MNRHSTPDDDDDDARANPIARRSHSSSRAMPPRRADGRARRTDDVGGAATAATATATDERCASSSSSSVQSAKIAQLTRVVYTLHAACEDARDERDDAERAHARALALTRYEASNAIVREVQAREDVERRRAVEALAHRARTRAMVIVSTDDAEARVRCELERAQKAYAMRDAEREALSARVVREMREECQRAREATERAREEALRVETETRMRVVESARATEARLMRDVEFERDERARLEREFEHDLAELRATCATEIEKVNAASAARDDAARRLVDDKDAEMRAMRDDVDRMLTDERTKAHDKYERQRVAYEFLEKTLGEAESELHATRVAHVSARDALDALHIDHASRGDALDALRITASAHETRIRELTGEVERLTALSTDAAEKLSQAQDAYVASIKERSELTRVIDDMRVERDAHDRAHAVQIDALNACVHTTRDELGESESARRREELERKRAMEAQQSTYEREREELSASYEARLKAMEVECAARHSHILDTHAERVRAIEAERASEVESVERSWAKRETLWRDERGVLQSEIESANARVLEAKHVSEAAQIRVRTLETELERTTSAFRVKELALKDDARESKIALQSVEALVHKMENELGERAMEYETRRLDAERMSREEIERLNAIWERKTAENVECALKELQRTHESAMERLTAELTARARADCTRAVANVSDAYQAVERELREELSSAKREHDEQTIERTARYEKDVADLRADFERRVSSMSASHANGIETLSTSHAERLELMHEDHERHLKRAMSEAVRLAVGEVEAQHATRLEELAEKSRLDRASDLKRAHDEHAKELEYLEREYETKLESCMTVSTALELERESLRDQVRRAREEVAAEALERSMENEKSREALAAAVYAHESDVSSIKSEHKKTIMRMQSSSEAATRAANDALSASRAETSKWRAMYENREARPEDLKRIENLESELALTTERLERSAAHRRTLQTELLGRAREFEVTPAARRAQAAYGTR